MESKWEKLGNILEPNNNIFWLKTYAGPSFAIPRTENIIDIYVTGRDKNNRSLIGLVQFNTDKNLIVNISENPILDLGEKGTFDENGISYPYFIETNNKTYMYYTGWIPGKLVPFMNDLGLAIKDNDEPFKRISKAPLLKKDDYDYLGIGSVCVFKEDNFWHMYYTSFDKWGVSKKEQKHYYNIKYACSNDGINWMKFGQICIDYKDSTEYSIAKPSVIKYNNKYHMWYSYRGNSYNIGYATSIDGRNWKRLDNELSLFNSKNGWDSEMVCYGHVFEHNKMFYMLYNGNNYGKTGLGIAKLNPKYIK